VAPGARFRGVSGPFALLVDLRQESRVSATMHMVCSPLHPALRVQDNEKARPGKRTGFLWGMELPLRILSRKTAALIARAAVWMSLWVAPHQDKVTWTV